MSTSSDEDVPIALKKSLKTADVAATNAPPPAAKQVKKPAPTDDGDSSSDEDVPLAQKQTKKKVPEKSPPSAAPVKKASATTAAKKSVPKKKPAPAPAKSSGSKGVSSGTERVKRVFDMPGQTRDTPDEDDALRKFYTSLLEQKPESEMARRWCAMTGLLSKEEAEKWVKEQAKKKGSKSPTKPVARRPASAGSGPKRKKAAASDDEEDEDDFKSTKKAKKSSKKKEAPAPKPKKEKKKPKPVSAEKEKKAKQKAESESEEWDSSDDEEIIPKAKQRGENAPKSAVKKKTTRDVAFIDGGMDDGSESDDDVPLLQRKKA